MLNEIYPWDMQQYKIHSFYVLRHAKNTMEIMGYGLRDSVRQMELRYFELQRAERAKEKRDKAIAGMSNWRKNKGEE